MNNVHVPVLLQETLEDLAITLTDVVVDATAGGGGHAKAIGQLLGPTGTLILLDQDEDALTRAKQAIGDHGCTVVSHKTNFRDIETVIRKEGIDAVDKVLFDLGLSTNQLELSGRGFSFKRDEPLLMTMDKDATITAFEIVNSYPEEEIANIIYEYGEERYSRRIARAIVHAREEKLIETSGKLAYIIEQSVPASYRTGKIHPATRSFQGIRIAVNDELGSLRRGLHGAWELLSVGGRISCITFHSLEDRIVKQYFASLVREEAGELVHKKPITASPDELKQNPKSRSAKLRTITKI
ncbi:MAG: 16S rRNA (cytosine(1402)-N(4))-methyltransferase [Candidatus Zambryskibacteria bacterium CG10_big_fil_rev_8_21_14_0_10_42_12]|uniref:Ribosomal RNA small subunit methyltransferase H n=1 Tax=Candidatus Zambryskibacteria bacterium CG10_big_fil_rev_8_21_14_0_10_42_12 TaxID=1975115 RepID=A0A2H0QUE3_9BACT|nr:MAG: 16S rRNA (cytosine(1402)-N(4))-methyltransferase [Candidatus Zambryskibacteria bacterium CG10_big_fil_rev_8_21_14_0_10_42_12]